MPETFQRPIDEFEVTDYVFWECHICIETYANDILCYNSGRFILGIDCSNTGWITDFGDQDIPWSYRTDVQILRLSLRNAHCAYSAILTFSNVTYVNDRNSIIL